MASLFWLPAPERPLLEMSRNSDRNLIFEAGRCGQPLKSQIIEAEAQASIKSRISDSSGNIMKFKREKKKTLGNSTFSLAAKIAPFPQ